MDEGKGNKKERFGQAKPFENVAACGEAPSSKTVPSKPGKTQKRKRKQTFAPLNQSSSKASARGKEAGLGMLASAGLHQSQDISRQELPLSRPQSFAAQASARQFNKDSDQRDEGHLKNLSQFSFDELGINSFKNAKMHKLRKMFLSHQDFRKADGSKFNSMIGSENAGEREECKSGKSKPVRNAGAPRDTTSWDS